MDRIIELALAEDNPRGDITALTIVAQDARATAVVKARQPGVLSGGDVFTRTMHLVDAQLEVEQLIPEGEKFEAGDDLLKVTGPAASLLTAERVGLNLLQRMSAIATATAQLVDLVAHTKARIVDTRKTTPGLRVLERYAVRCGGGVNHRDNLSDAFMAKDNHLALLDNGEQLTAALKSVRARLGHTTSMEVEVDSIEQIPPVLAAGVDIIMLDNFDPADIPAAIELIDGQAVVEASGNINASTVVAVAEAGVDVISSGAITHSVKAIDLGLDMVIA
ncbi:MAG TPA: carboxylating nicotinate-nucleotide diphosphorylase [Glutamicibacter sp.]|uniref:Nicotinate-nucleotide pyrophosphorylase [carboxylating] n=2 Tax=Glutamicibacter arilaitensis TaxID=256701 RepID=A0A2N7S7C1_9MICC|nr:MULTISPECIES: carboxylating nicotinate-nucleotide diphosphorylase [Glutamicibacter]PMQ22024.1 nicotinate-nucleotide diphosphorylase (carboxylating) [Glutamicibacter arilaitensis]TFH57806.1 carboxylating nicotinate-nucleotide diphosphorylase [Glutamicibacter arilaitensis]HCH48557.1 carboxylating nicotinate-nucleotide diphosphorylase [Glutamicibacter sp.]HCM93310.1 carboxylating nicotinate-nucleotide diphosphorylase [Glutamicibacter sp.]